MTPFLEGLIEELKDYEAGRARRAGGQGRRARIAIASEDLRALALLRAETTRIGALAAAMTSLANRSARDPGKAATTPTPSLTLSFPASVDTQIGQLAGAEAFFELQQLWLALRARLAFVSQLTAVQAAETGAAPIRPTFTAEVVADAWCRTCTILAEFLAHVMQIMADAGISAGPPHEAQVIALLQQAAAGRCPCLDADGRFVLPGWAERRRERRRSVSSPAELVLGISTFPVMIENLSSRGLHVALPLVVPEGSRVTIVLSDGRRLAAAVSWCNGGHAGLALAEPLADTDPLWTATEGQRGTEARSPHVHGATRTGRSRSGT